MGIFLNFRDVRNPTLYDIHAVFGHGKCICYENEYVDSHREHGEMILILSDAV